MNAGSETSTLVADLARTVHSLSGSPALCFHDGHRWGPVTWAEHGRHVRHITLGLDAAGVGPGARVAVAVDRGPTRRAADLAVLCAGGVLVGPSSREPHVVVDAVELDAMVEAGGEIDGGQPDRFERLSTGLAPKQPAVEVAGAAGPVTVTHANLAWTVRSLRRLLGPSHRDRFLACGPPESIAIRVLGDLLPLSVGACTWLGAPGRVLTDLTESRPAIAVAPTAAWEEVWSFVDRQLAGADGLRRGLVREHLRLGRHRAAEGLGRLDALRHAALSRTVGARLLRDLGLDQARALIAAGLVVGDLAESLQAAGVPVATVWGPDQACGVVTLAPPARVRPGSAGRPIPGASVRVAEDGEVLVRGGNVAGAGADGWLRTGERGGLDEAGELRLVASVGG